MSYVVINAITVPKEPASSGGTTTVATDSEVWAYEVVQEETA